MKPDKSTLPPEAPSSIFSLIHEIQALVAASIDTALTWEQLNSPPINYTLVRPIVERVSPFASDQDEKTVAELLNATRSVEAGHGSALGSSSSRRSLSLGAVLFAFMANRCGKQE